MGFKIWSKVENQSFNFENYLIQDRFYISGGKLVCELFILVWMEYLRCFKSKKKKKLKCEQKMIKKIKKTKKRKIESKK